MTADTDVIKSLILINDKIKNNKTGIGFDDIMKMIMKYAHGIVSAIADVGSILIGFFNKKPDTKLRHAYESLLHPPDAEYRNTTDIFSDEDDRYEDARGEGLHNKDLLNRCIEYLHHNGYRVCLP